MTAKEKLLTDCPFLRGKLTEEAINYIAISMKSYADDAFEAGRAMELSENPVICLNQFMNPTKITQNKAND
jgi:hypothetical protein